MGSQNDTTLSFFQSIEINAHTFWSKIELFLCHQFFSTDISPWIVQILLILTEILNLRHGSIKKAELEQEINKRVRLKSKLM
jgi:hypothetical protein